MDAEAQRHALLRTGQRPRPQARSFQRHHRAAPDRLDFIARQQGQRQSRALQLLQRFCYIPPIIGFSSTSWKDSVVNIQETGEFVWNLATMDLAKQMNATAAHVAHDVSEFEIAGLTAAPGKLVNVPRVGGKPGVIRMQIDADHPVAGRRRQEGAGLADARRGRRRPYRQGHDQGRRLPDRIGPPDRTRRPHAAIISRSGRKRCSRWFGRIEAACPSPAFCGRSRKRGSFSRYSVNLRTCTHPDRIAMRSDLSGKRVEVRRACRRQSSRNLSAPAPLSCPRINFALPRLRSIA